MNGRNAIFNLIQTKMRVVVIESNDFLMISSIPSENETVKGYMIFFLVGSQKIDHHYFVHFASEDSSYELNKNGIFRRSDRLH